MKAGQGRGVSWGSVALGWLVAVLAGAGIRALLGGLYGSVAGLPAGTTDATAVVFALVSDFLAYLLGGFTAGRFSGHSGALNGAMTAVLGLVLGLVASAVLASSGVVLAWGVAVPPANFGLGREALAAGLLLFLSDLFGGYVGGELAEPARPAPRRLG